MASRSTRNKLRYKAKKLIDCVDTIESYLQEIDNLAQGQSEYINRMMPDLLVLCEGARSIFRQFRDGL